MRRAAIVLVVVTGVLFLAAASLAQGPGVTAQSPRAPAARPPMKIGMISHLTGVYAQQGKDEVDGAKLALDEAKWEVAGRQVDLVIVDDQGEPSVTVTKARKLVEQDQVHAAAGILWSPSGLAIRNYMDAQKVPMIYTGTAVRELTQERYSPYIFRVSFATGQEMRPFGRYVAERLGYKKAVAFSFDSPFGREQVAYFKEGFEEAGGKVIQEAFTGVATPDFAPYLPTLKVNEADVILAIWAGAAAVRLFTQWDEFGYRQRLPMVAFGGGMDEPIIDVLGEKALGIISPYHYAVAIDTAENRRFKNAYRQKYGKETGAMAEQGYVAINVLLRAARAIGGDVENKERFSKAIEEVRFEAPRGPFRFDAYHNPIQNFYITQVKKSEGKVQKVVIDVMPELEQYWPKGKPKSQR